MDGPACVIVFTASERDHKRTQFRALAKALPRALFDQFDRPQDERRLGKTLLIRAACKFD